MSGEANEALIRRLYDDVWNRGDPDACYELVEATEIHHSHGQTVSGGPEAQARAARVFRNAFPDNVLTVEVVVATEELVAARWRIAATHAKTGKAIADYVGVNIFRIRDGKIVEIWDTRDDLGLLAQLGLVPPAPELMAQMYDPMET